MKKLLSLILAMVMCFGLFGCATAPAAPAATEVPAETPAEAPAEAPAEEPAELAEDVVVLYTNDVHTYIDGPLSYDVLAGIKQELQKTYGTVILVDAGDHAQGTAYGSMDKGETIVSLMNAAGYDLATLGNHEFDYDMPGRISITDEWAQYPYLSCNFYNETAGVRGESVLDAYKLFTVGEAKIAFVGITTPESFTKSTPAYFMDDNSSYIYGIAGGTDGAELYADVQAAIDAAKAEGAAKVVLLGHLGLDESSQPWTSAEVIANVSGADAFIDGHSHSKVPCDIVNDKDGNPVVLTQTGEYFKNIGMMILGADGSVKTDLITSEAIEEVVKDEAGNPVLDQDGKETTEVVGYKLVSELYTGAEWPVDETVAQLKADWLTKIDEQLGTVIGDVAVTLDNYDADGNRLVRKQSTNSGDFAADALYYLFDNMGLDVDVALMNGGGIRNKAVTGEFTYKTAKSVHTFGNVACLQTVTGQDIIEALEWGARAVPEELGGFMHVAGLTYKIDSAWPTSVQMDDKGVWVGAPTGGYRVSDVQVFNKETGAYEPIDPNGTYNIAGYNYTLRDLGDGYNMFSAAVNVLDYVMEDYMVLANYVLGFEGGNVDATNSPLLAKYPSMLIDYSDTNGSGRIVIE